VWLGKQAAPARAAFLRPGQGKGEAKAARFFARKETQRHSSSYEAFKLFLPRLNLLFHRVVVIIEEQRRALNT